MSLAMFLYSALGSDASDPPGRYSGLGANSSFQGPDSVVVEWDQTPRLVAAPPVPPPKRSARMPVLSTSAPPPRPPGWICPRRGFASTYTPVPTKDVAPVLDSPVAYHSRC